MAINKKKVSELPEITDMSGYYAFGYKLGQSVKVAISTLKGNTGPIGPKGDKGDAGIQGIPGVKGDQGDTGPQGPQGDKGDPGLKGNPGDTGPKGDPGDKGDKGDGLQIVSRFESLGALQAAYPAGTVGSFEVGIESPYHLYYWDALNGMWNDSGVLQGVPGPQGPLGPKGDKGDSGAEGPQGVQGPPGEQGIQGPPGDKGETGFQGNPGPKGETGDSGAPGQDGVSITNANVNEDGNLIITLSSGSEINTGTVVPINNYNEDAKAIVDFFTGANTVTTLAGLPIDKYRIAATLTSPSVLSLSGIPTIASREFHLIVKCMNAMTIVLPSTGGYVDVDNIGSVVMAAGGKFELSIIYDSIDNQNRMKVL